MRVSVLALITLWSGASQTAGTAAAGAAFTITITGSTLGTVTGLEFDLIGTQSGGPGGGMMGGGGTNGSGMGQGIGTADANIKVSAAQVNSAGTQMTAVQTLSAAAAGTRQVRSRTPVPMGGTSG